MAERERTADANKDIDKLLFVKKLSYIPGVDYGGWKKELLVEEIASVSEEKLLLCTLCKGMLRDACVVTVDQKKEAHCDVCVPRDYYTADTRKIAELVRSVIDEKMIYCPMLSEDCKWTGPTIEILSHLESCQYLPVPCPLGCINPNILHLASPDVIQKIQRKLLESHLTNTCPMRLIPCEYCQKKIKASIVNSHLYICEEYPIQCPNKCTFQSWDGDTFVASRRVINNHLQTDCPLQQVDCPYSEYGCEDKVLRKDVQLQVLDSLKHLQLVESCLKKTRVELQNQIDEKKKLVNNQLLIGGVEWRIRGIERRKNKGKEFTSLPFYSSGYKLRFTVKFNIADHIGVFIQLLKGENDNQLTWPFKSKVSFILVGDSVMKGNHEEFFLTEYIIDSPCLKKPATDSNGLFGFSNFISYANIQSYGYCTDDSLLLRVLCKCYLDSVI